MPSTEKTGGPGSPKRSTATQTTSVSGGGSRSVCNGRLAEKPPVAEPPAVDLPWREVRQQAHARQQVLGPDLRRRVVDHDRRACLKIGEVHRQPRHPVADPREIEQASDGRERRAELVERWTAPLRRLRGAVGEEPAHRAPVSPAAARATRKASWPPAACQRTSRWDQVLAPRPAPKRHAAASASAPADCPQSALH